MYVYLSMYIYIYIYVVVTPWPARAADLAMLAFAQNCSHIFVALRDKENTNK